MVIKRKWPIEPLASEEFEALVATCNPKTAAGLRDRALLCLLGGAGLRLSEALALEQRDIDFGRGTINVRRGKGAKQRLVGLAFDAAARVEVWARFRRDRLGLPARGPLICTYSKNHAGKPLGQPDVANMMKRRAKRAGIEKRVHPHGLRHSFTGWLAQQGTPIHLIANQLGHSSIATTNIYLSVVDPREAAAATQGLRLFSQDGSGSAETLAETALGRA